jgi:signal transduction histidine kinase
MPPAAPSPGASELSFESVEQTRALRDLQWLTRLRWFAILGVTLTAGAAAQLGLLSTTIWPLLAVAGVMGVYNALLDWRFSSMAAPYTGRVMRAILGQMLVDIVALTLLLHWSGSSTNPFAMYFVFHAAIAAMFLPRTQAWLVGLVAFQLHAGAVALEAAGVISSYPLVGASPHRELSFTLGYIAAFGTMLAGVVFFVQTIAQRQRDAERRRVERERVAISLERLARVGEVSAGVAHSVRNPLHGLLNCVEILERRLRGDAEVAEITSMMREGLTRIEQVTARLLVLSRDDPLRKQPMALNALVREAARMVRAGAPKSRINEELDASGESLVEMDPARFSEALINVLDNAVAACREKGEVTVKAQVDTQRHVANVEVRDSGTGIDAAVLPRVFDPFFTTKAVGEGTGLGLAIAKRTLEQHGGEITVRSQKGVGTQVLLTLPASNGQTPGPAHS